MTVAGGRSPIVSRRIVYFFLAALLSAMLLYGALAEAGSLLWGSPNRTERGLAIALAGLILLARYGRTRRAPIPPSGRQISKRMARSGSLGAFAYGAVLGAGILTVVSTPAVWLGAGLSLFTGAWSWGLLYGAAFGAGRSLLLITTYIAGDSADPEIALRIVERGLSPRSATRLIGILGGAFITFLATLIIIGFPHGIVA